MHKSKKIRVKFVTILTILLIASLQIILEASRSSKATVASLQDEMAPSETDFQEMPDTSLVFRKPSRKSLPKTALERSYTYIDYKHSADILESALYVQFSEKHIYTKSYIATEKLLDRIEVPRDGERAELLYQISHNSHLDVAYPFKSVKVGSLLHPSLKAIEYPMNLTDKMNQDTAVKYFYELPGHNHLDARFGNKSVHDNESDRVKNLKLMFTAWALFCDKNQIPYNIAHGVLLGWMWNQKIMPWDNDLDVNVPANYLPRLVEMNDTLIFARYLLDVNPEIVYRRESNWNVIDARFIDSQTGYYIDITGLSVSTLPFLSKLRKLNYTLLHDKKPSPHKYKFTDVYPLVRTTFEGIPTWRPFNVTAMILEEYEAQGTPESYTYFNYRFDPFAKEWIQVTSCESLHRLHIVPRLEDTLPRTNYTKREPYTIVWNSHNDTADNPSNTSCSLVFWKFRNGVVLDRRVLFGEWEDEEEMYLPALPLSFRERELLESIQRRNLEIFEEQARLKKEEEERVEREALEAIHLEEEKALEAKRVEEEKALEAKREEEDRVLEAKRWEELKKKKEERARRKAARLKKKKEMVQAQKEKIPEMERDAEVAKDTEIPLESTAPVADPIDANTNDQQSDNVESTALITDPIDANTKEQQNDNVESTAPIADPIDVNMNEQDDSELLAPVADDGDVKHTEE